MGKLGKKARKFAKKNLQSVLKTRRKTKALLKSRYSSKDKKKIVKEQVKSAAVLPTRRDPEDEEFEDIYLDEIFNLKMLLTVMDLFPRTNIYVDNNDLMGLSVHRRKVNEELAVKKKVNSLCVTIATFKDSDFAMFLRSHEKGLEVFRDEAMDSDEDRTSNHSMQLVNGDGPVLIKDKALTISVINSWCQRAKEEHNDSALNRLLNVYRASCQN